ncbi:MAG: asparagine synthetase B family protein [Methanofollis sp.]|uniref:asparagine synthase-related protein n=1 Tax=Methanofollis sp. TaxID=2052835 RepID=UPI002606EE3A|nr:asparagine synthetase B family protein [Methanofollis sp.]MDD4254299.1 asparagine synthetase B family protein [Methanofollis sp.]
MQVEIRLSNHFSPWRHVETDKADCSIKGHIFVDNRLADDEEIASRLSQEISGPVTDRKDLAGLLSHLNGEYVIVIDAPDRVLCVVDRIRSIPIYYSEIPGKLLISDDAHALKEAMATGPDDRRAAEFLVTGFVTGRGTLFHGIEQIQAGEFLLYDKITGKTDLYPHYCYQHGEFFPASEKQMIEQLDRVCTNIFNRLIETTVEQGKHIVVPLSGGLDSRILVAMLKRLGVEDVTCFTYGIRNNRESRFGREVADALGYPWYFVEYTAAKWEEMYCSPELVEVLRYSGNLTALPHIQDMAAVRELKKLDIIPDGSVFVPGHGADVLSGCKIPPSYNIRRGCTSEEAIHYVLADHHSYWDWGNDGLLTKIFEERIRSIIPAVRADDRESGANAIEFFDYRERQAKYIINSVRTYEYYGYEWRIPFWDNEFMEFFMKVPLQYRMKQRLYKLFAREKLFTGDLKELKYIECTTKIDDSLPQRWISAQNKLRLIYDRIADRGIYALWYRDLQSMLLKKNSLMTDISSSRYPLVRTMVMQRRHDPSALTIISLLNLEYLLQCGDIPRLDEGDVKSKKECIWDVGISDYSRETPR